jgi:competence ComEA-like helix-hairpin-helix protein
VALSKPPISINTADLDELKAFSGIGPTKVQVIIDYRATRLFEKVKELLKTNAIGHTILNEIESLVTVVNKRNTGHVRICGMRFRAD